jgi:hypothetical protein
MKRDGYKKSGNGEHGGTEYFGKDMDKHSEEFISCFLLSLCSFLFVFYFDGTEGYTSNFKEQSSTILYFW